MASLPDQVIRTIQDYLDAAPAEIAPLTINTERPIEDWQALLATAPKVSPLVRPFDPALNYPFRAFWLTLDFKGEPIACVGARLFETKHFINEWVSTYRMFGDKTPRMVLADVTYPNHPPELAGNVVFGGGSWVHPDWRGIDLSGVTSRLGKIIALRHFAADYYVGFIRDDRTKWAMETLGWTNSYFLSHGEHPTRPNFLVDVRMFWMTTHDLLNMSPVALSPDQKRKLKSHCLLAELSGDTNAQCLQCCV